MTFFQDNAEKLLEKKADEIGQLKDSEDNSQAYEEIFNQQRFLYKIFRLRLKNDHFNVNNNSHNKINFRMIVE